MIGRGEVLVALSVVCAALAHAQAGAAAPLRSTIDILPCGPATARLTSRCTASGELQCADQTMTIQPNATPISARNVPLLGRTRQGLTAIVQSWACVASPAGLRYFLLDDRCAPGSAGCSEDEPREWTQLIDIKGRNLDAGHGWNDAISDAVIRQAGLAGLLARPGVKMQALSFVLGK